jgi:hypothetical protein
MSSRAWVTSDYSDGLSIQPSPFRRGSTQSRMCEISTSLTSWQEESNAVHNKSTLNELYPIPKKNPLRISEPCLTNVGMQSETSHTKNVSFPANHHASIFSGGRLEGSKCNLNLQSATWHHFKHFQRKAEGDQPVISAGAASWPGWTSTHVGTLTFLSEDS